MTKVFENAALEGLDLATCVTLGIKVTVATNLYNYIAEWKFEAEPRDGDVNTRMRLVIPQCTRKFETDEKCLQLCEI